MGNLSQNSYNNLISLTLSVLESVFSLFVLESVFSSVDKKKEERRRALDAAKVLPELFNIRPEEEKRVSDQLKKFYPVMKKVISKGRNKGVKEALGQNKSIPSDTRK